MKETIYTYNSGTISTDGKSLVLKKDRTSPIGVEWAQIGEVVVHSTHTLIGGEKNYVHQLKLKSTEGAVTQEWRMPNLETAQKAKEAITKYRELHPSY